MANEFDQFDAGNPFDQFDKPGTGQGSVPGTQSSAAAPQPSFSQQLLKHLANAYVAPYQQYSAAKDAMGNFLTSYTGGLSDRASALMQGVPYKDVQAQTAAERERLGPVLSMATGGAGYMMGPGKILGPGAKMVSGPLADVAGGIVPSVLEGTVAGGGQAAGEGKDVQTGAITGGVGGAVATPLSSAGNAVIRMGSNLIGARPPLPGPEAMSDAEKQMWDQTTGVRFSPKDTQKAARGAQSDASAGGQPMTEIGNPAAHKLLNNFSDYSGDPTSTHSLADLIAWQNKAKALSGNDAKFGQMLSDRIDQTIQGNPQASSVTPAKDVPLAIQQAQQAQGMAKQYNENIANPPPTALGNLANVIGSHSWSLGHHATQPMVAPAAEALGLGGLAYEQTGHWLPALGAVGATLVSQPALNAGAKAVGNWQRNVSADAANRALMGISNPSYQDSLRQILLGGVSGTTP